MPSRMPAQNSITSTPAIRVAALRPSAAAASSRVRSPGKATAQPIFIPAAPASTVAVSSVTPWIISHPPAS